MRIITVIFAIIGVVAVALVMGGIMFARGCSADDEFQVENTLKSPSGDHTAIVYSRMGGGAAGWCYTYLTVLKSPAVFEPQSYQHNPLLPQFGCSQRVVLEWLDKEALRVGIEPGADGVVEANFVSGLPIGDVQLEYVLGKPPS